MTSISPKPGRRYDGGMNDTEIAEKIERLNSVMIVGSPIAMGAAFYAACKDRGLVALDIEPRDANPSYRGLCPIRLLPGLPDWEFQIGPPNA